MGQVQESAGHRSCGAVRCDVDHADGHESIRPVGCKLKNHFGVA
jgi:hypothetical protein